jgi:SAM-dependent methyltransferase
MGDSNPDWGYAGASGDAMRAYEQTLVSPIFEPWARLLLKELALQPGEYLIDVATGPGTLARVAASRLGQDGRVLACDLSPAMLALAVEKPTVPNGAPIDYVECPPASLTVPTASYDVVGCQQGLQFFSADWRLSAKCAECSSRGDGSAWRCGRESIAARR